MNDPRISAAPVTTPAHSRLTRRRLLGAIAAGAAGALLAACGEAVPAATTTPAPAATMNVAPVGGTAAPPPSPTAAATAAATRPAIATVSATNTAPLGAAGVPPWPTPDAAGKIAAPAPGVLDAYLKPPPLYRTVTEPPGRGGKVTVLNILNGAPPPPREQNQYWQHLEKLLNVSMYDANLVPSASYGEKFAALAASGDLPDLCWLSADYIADIGRYVQQGVFTDLTPYLTGDALKAYPTLATFDSTLWRNVPANGKIYGVPRPDRRARFSLLFRQDWADTVGVPKPMNADAFERMAVAFTKNDPDGNGKPDTYGLSSSSGGFAVDGFFASLFGAPNGWRKNADGTLVRDIETPEYKAAVDYARRAVSTTPVRSPTRRWQRRMASSPASSAGTLGASPRWWTARPPVRR